MSSLSFKQDERIIVGLKDSDDAAAVRFGKEIILQTVDIITPIVDNPYIFGQIAAANALSDIFAMGGTPLSVLNIACFPVDCLDLEILKEIFEGGLSKIDESGAFVVGGHTITDKEIKYGLAVNGFAGNKIYQNNSCIPGLDIILTKPIGAGIVSTALKGEMIEEKHKTEMIKWMTRLNKYAASVAGAFDVITMTDVTGFGLLGHLLEILRASNLSAIIYDEKVPFLDGFNLYLSYGLIPAGAYRNKEFVEPFVSGKIKEILKLSSPETSGGLLIFCKKNRTQDLLKSLIDGGDIFASLVGETIPADSKFRIFIA